MSRILNTLRECSFDSRLSVLMVGAAVLLMVAM